MKLFKTLFFVTSLFSIASCATKGNQNTSKNNGTQSSSQAEQEAYGTILKKIADDMFDYGGAVRQNNTQSIRKALEPVDESHRGPEIQLPAVLVYLTGVVSDIENADPINKALEFTGVYEFDYSRDETPNWTEQTIGLTINAEVDKTNNKVFFSGLENVEMNGSVMANSYIFMDISYNFETQVLGDFKMYMDQGSATSVYYFQSVNGQASKSGQNTTAEEMSAFKATFDSYVTEFNALCQTKVVAEGALLTACKEAFVTTQKYANGLFGQKVDSVRIKQAA